MRLTVGPLAPAVYWRRRAVVAAILALVLVPLFFAVKAMSDDDGKARRPAAGGDTHATSEAASQMASNASPSANLGDSSPPVGPVESTPDRGSPGPSDFSTAPIPLTGDRKVPACSDADIALTADVAPKPGVFGGTFSLSLTIRNTSPNECSRDIGSGPQEVRVLRQGATVWSSNDCGAPADSDVRTFPVAAGVRFTVQWNSFRIAPRPCQVAAEPTPPGTYQVVARLGEKVSEPVPFEIAR